ncbi:phage tail tape measure protein [Candidatus Manganitrophus noduliformans]|uniref:Phage tail tape measure protein domain-containing protein n=1 Tax=Candidatus Manganitrophus noduliformans TaxID=2606439 RepID=A0A7X6DQ35_9BACT|nr:phage tail tape measure protein [Candidatus Manganitrophus noduliformans]NKE71252.1 hypothetical protein [Candidatus Manganitrophus noduliformans]
MSQESLILKIGAQFDGLKSGLQGALGEYNGFLKGLGDGKQILGAVSVAIAGVGAAALGLATSAANTGDHLIGLSDKTGISVEQLSLLKFAAEQNKTDIDKLAVGMTQLAKNMNEASDGTGKAAEIFKELGIDVKDVDGSLRPVNEVMLDLADAIAGMQDPAKQSAILMELMGKSGIDLASFMKQGGQTIRETTEAARGMGLEMSGNSAKAGAAFLDNMSAITTVVGNLGTQLGASLLEPLAEITAIILQAIIPAAKTMTDWFKELDSDTKKWIVGISALGVALGSAVVAIGAVTTAVGLFGGAFTGGLAILGAVVTALTGPVGLAIAGVAAAITAAIVVWKNWDKIVAAFERTAKAVTGFIQDMVAGIRQQLIDRFNAIVDGVKDKIEAVKGFFKDLYDAVVGNSYIPDMVAEIAHEMGDGLQRGMVDNAKSATKQTGEFFEGLGRHIKFSIGDAVAGAIVYHEDLKKSFEDIGKAILASVIAFGTRIMTEWAAMEAFRLATTETTNAKIAASNTAASTGIGAGAAGAGGMTAGQIGGAIVGGVVAVDAANRARTGDNGDIATAFVESPIGAQVGLVLRAGDAIFGGDETDHARLKRKFGKPAVEAGVRRAAGGDWSQWHKLHFNTKAATIIGIIDELGMEVNNRRQWRLSGSEKEELARLIQANGLWAGGIVSKPMLARIAEGGESEVVAPLSRLREMLGGVFGGGGNINISVSLPNIRKITDFTDHEAEQVLKTTFNRASRNLSRRGYTWGMQPGAR